MKLEVHCISCLVSNAYVIQSDSGLVVVDTGMPGAARLILNRIRALGAKLTDLRLIVLTHAHIDHAGSAADLRMATGAPIALHPADAPKAHAGRHTMPHGRGHLGLAVEKTVNALRVTLPFKSFCPEVKLEDDFSLKEFGIPGRIIYTPGHTVGSVSLLLEDGRMFVGDAIVNQWHVSFPLYWEDARLAIDSGKRILACRPRQLFSGHGKPFAADDLRRYLEDKQRMGAFAGY